MQGEPSKGSPEVPTQSLGAFVGKYFLHGIVFAAISLVVIFVWAFLFVVLVIFGFFIGLIIGVILLFFFLGYVNAGITSMIWHIDIKTDWKSILGHGFVLFIAPAIAQIPSLILSLAYPGILTTVTIFLTYCFIDGFVGRQIAGHWQDAYEDFEVEPLIRPSRDTVNLLGSLIFNVMIRAEIGPQRGFLLGSGY